MIKAQNLVAGQWQDNLEASTFCTLNPITNKPLTTQFQEASSSQIHDSLIKASTIFESYASTSFKVRIVFLQSIQKELNKSSNERLSLVLAFDPNPETIIDPKEVFGPKYSTDYEPISCGDYLIWRFGKAFSYRN